MSDLVSDPVPDQQAATPATRSEAEVDHVVAVRREVLVETGAGA